MISLVTQSDGSARRFPFVSIGLALAMALTFSSLREQTAKAQVEVDTAMAEAIADFEAQPSLTIPDAMTRYIPAERAATLREEASEARSEAGLYDAPKSLLSRRQTRFEGLVDEVFAALGKLPANSFAVTGEQDPLIRHFDHFLHHASLEALALSLFAVLLFGMALEDAWGSLVFGAFCAASIPIGAQLYTAFPPPLAQPWMGAAGLSIAVLGATAARWPKSGSPRLLGGFPLAPWLFIPAWFAADALLVQKLSAATLELTPAVVYASLLASGYALAVAIRRLGFEEKLTDRWDDSNVPVKNPSYEKAMDLRTGGKREEAMEILVSEFARKASVDIALGMWDVSKELGRADAGAAGVLHLIRDALRRKDEAAAASFWCELAEMVEFIDAEPALFVKIAEVLGAGGKHEQAAIAIDCSTRAPQPLSPGLALRAARLVADHDRDVASRVAMRAIEGSACSKKEVAALRNFVVEEPVPGAMDEMPAEKRTPGGEPLVVKRRELKGFKGLIAKASGPLAAPHGVAEEQDGVAPPSSAEVDEVYENLDPDALDPSALGADEDLDQLIGESSAVNLSEVQSEVSDVDRWNSPGLVTDLSEGLPSDGYGAVDVAALDTEAVRAELFGGSEDDLLASSIEDQLAAEGTYALRQTSDELEAAAATAPTGLTGEPEAEETTDVFLATDRPTLPIFDDDEADPLAAPSSLEFRSVHVIEAVPLALEGAAIRLDAAGKGKTRLPFERIDAVAVGGVRGLSERPVVLVDLVLNLRGDPSEALRVLRIRSDRFDPRSMVAGASSGVEALKMFVAAIVAESRADLLPSETAVRGEPFAMFDSLVDYHREVLKVDGEAA